VSDFAPPRDRRISRHRIPVEDADLALTVARSGGSGAALAIFPSAFGIGADLEEQMSELSERASVVAAFDPFARSAPGFVPYEDLQRVITRIQALDRERAARDFRAVIEWARKQAPSGAVVALGICFGGPYALLAAADGAVAGVVAWHGTALGQHLARAAEMRCPMRLHFGGADPFVAKEEVEAVRAAFEARPDVRIAVHEGATHGFTHRAAPQAFDARAERAAMDAALELLAALA